MKRIFDCVIAGIGLLVSAPISLIIALAIRLTSPGPVFFRQERVGRHGAIFEIRKFRTMRTGHNGPVVATANDSRVTQIGRVLRKTKLDELPQLLDVLQGHMSLVGPRPEVAQYVALWPKHLREEILSVRPGITDPGSIVYRNEAEELEKASNPEQYYVEHILPRKAQMYAEYVRERSFFGDIRILIVTAQVVLRGTSKNFSRDH